jgi:ribosome-binding factor A
MRHAKIHVSIMGDEAKQQLCLHGLEHARGFLQQKVAKRIDTRYTPKLRFLLDKGVKHSIEVTRILGELFPDEARMETEGMGQPDSPPADTASGNEQLPEDNRASTDS